MTDHIKVNINWPVRVRLTDRGRRVHREEVEPCLRGMFPYTPPEEDARGYSRFLLWELMKIFGHHITMGGDLLFETNIEIEMGEPT